MDLRLRLSFMNRLHESVAGTASICIGAASRVPGSVVAAVRETHAEAKAYPQFVPARQVEHFGWLFAGCAEPVGGLGVQFGRVAGTESEPGIGQDELDLPGEDARPCVAFVAALVGRFVRGQDEPVHLDPACVVGEPLRGDATAPVRRVHDRRLSHVLHHRTSSSRDVW